jgi:diadenosine tetraphosphate (Ap4A) HIT family hydrolase
VDVSSATFELHPQLSADTFHVGDWPLCRVLRMNDAGFPWLILVPRRADIREIIDLAEADQRDLMSEIARASRALRDLVQPDKLNVAALGNAVPQLHVHVIARFRTDPAWPRPIWGVKPPEPFGAREAAAEIDRLKSALAPLQ